MILLSQLLTVPELQACTTTTPTYNTSLWRKQPKSTKVPTSAPEVTTGSCWTGAPSLTFQKRDNGSSIPHLAGTQRTGTRVLYSLPPDVWGSWQWPWTGDLVSQHIPESADKDSPSLPAQDWGQARSLGPGRSTWHFQSRSPKVTMKLTIAW